MDRILTNEELEKLNSTDGIIELLCGGDKFKSLSEEEKQELIDYTLNINLISDWQIESNLLRSRNDNNLALLEKRKLIALSLLYFGKKDESGKYVTYTCPYTGKEYNISEIERELEKKRSEKDSNKRLELEHIMPHSGGGGTVLFNCLLSSVEANGIGEKWNFHLLDWFNQSGKKYYIPDRLNRIVCYMLSAYSVAYKEYKENELEFDYEFVDGEQGYTDNDDINTITKKQIKQKEDKSLDRQNVKETYIFEYKKFLDSLVNKLKEDNYDITAIDKKIKELEEQGIFKANKKYELIQSIVEDIFKEESNDTSYLTNSLKVDYYKLVDSINFEQEEDIKKEIVSRIDTIKSILKKNNKSMKDYYISMKDLQDIDLLYIPIGKLDDSNKKIFGENIRLSFDTKINIFMDMLSEDEYTRYENGNPDSNNIFGRNNKISFEGYEDIDGLSTSFFWGYHSSEIKKRLEERLDELNNKKNITEEEQNKLVRLIKAQTAIEKYEFANRLNVKGKIDVFIDMLSEDKYTRYENGNPDNNNIFKDDNKIKFEGYEDIDGLNTRHFWRVNSLKIKKRLKEQLEELNDKQNRTEEEQNKLFRLIKAQTAIEKYEFANRLNTKGKIDVFIDMLSEDKYTRYENGEPDNNNIFKQKNKIPFEGYEDIAGLYISDLWGKHSSEIKKILEQRLDEFKNKENMTEEEQEKFKKLDKDQTAIKYYEFANRSNLVGKIDVFIDMLSKEEYTSYEDGNPNCSNIFGQDNKIKFEGYKDIDGLYINTLWSDHSSEIKNRLEQQLKELNKKENKTEEEQDKLIKLKEAQIAIEKYEFANKYNLVGKIDVFIDMLGDKEYTSYKNGNPDSNNIFKAANKIPFEGYEDIDGLYINNFWSSNSSKINNRLEERFDELNSKQNKTQEEQDKFDRLKKAQKAIENYKFKTNLEKRIDVFIDMLIKEEYTSYKKNGHPDNNNIFKDDNKIKFEGYEDIDGLDTSDFWNTNRNTHIIPLLFYNKYYDSKEKKFLQSDKDYSGEEYDIARTKVLNHLKVKNIDEYVNQLRIKDKKTVKVQNLINLVEILRDKKERLAEYRDGLLEENTNLKQEIMNNMVVTSYGR